MIGPLAIGYPQADIALEAERLCRQPAMSFEAITQRLPAMRANRLLFFTIGDPAYLKAGGKISLKEYLGIKLLHRQPVFTLSSTGSRCLP